jgi:hypothetical protein
MLPNYCNEKWTVFYSESFWNDVKILLEKLRIGIHILSLKNLVFGYKIEDEYYNSINYFLTILLFTIYKSHYVSKQVFYSESKWDQ